MPNLDLCRVSVTAPELENLRFSERQELAWRILDEHFSRYEQFHISSIHMMAPDELEGDD